jgi:hypothetical protein
MRTETGPSIGDPIFKLSVWPFVFAVDPLIANESMSPSIANGAW